MKLAGKLLKNKSRRMKMKKKQENNLKQNEIDIFKNNGEGHPIRNERDSLNLYFMIFLLAVAAAGFLYIMRMFFVPILVALTLATLFYPLYNWLTRKLGGRRGLAALLGCLAVILVLLIPLYGVIHLLTLQLLILYRAMESKDMLSIEGIKNIMGTLENMRLFRWVADLNIDWQAGLRNAIGSIGQAFSYIVEKTSAGVIGLVTNAAITLFTLFYFFKDGESILKHLLYLSPLRAEYEERILTRFSSISRATINGTIVLGLIQGGMGALTLLIFGIKTWIIWGVVMVFLSVIPVLGTWLVMVPVGIVMLISGKIFAGITIIVVSIVIIGAADNLLRPILVGSSAKMHDLLVFFSTIGGLAVFGIIGFLVGPVIAAFFTTLLSIYGMEFKESLRAETPEIGKGEESIEPGGSAAGR